MKAACQTKRGSIKSKHRPSVQPSSTHVFLLCRKELLSISIETPWTWTRTHGDKPFTRSLTTKELNVCVLVFGRKPEYLEKSYTCTGKTSKLDTEKGHKEEANLQPFSCGATFLTTAPAKKNARHQINGFYNGHVPQLEALTSLCSDPFK